MRQNSHKIALEAVTLLYGAAILIVANLWASELLPLGWLAPALFYIYETIYVWMLGRLGGMAPQKGVVATMIYRGVKFLGVAVMMLVWVKAALPEKNAFLLYTLGYYLLTSLMESWCMVVANKAQKQDKV